MTSKLKNAIIAIGVWNGVMFIFHCFFPVIFRWEETLAVLDRFDWAIFQTYHLIMLLVAVFSTYVSIRHPQDLLESVLGGVVLLTFAMVPIIRLTAEFIYFGFDGAVSLVTLVTSLITAGVYLLGFRVWIRPAAIG